MEEQVTVIYSPDVRARMEQAIENCLFTFNMMSRVWTAEANIKAAKDSIIAEVIQLLELPRSEEDE